MAYAKINQLLEGQEEAQKTNIFAPQGGTSQVAGGEAPAGSIEKTGQQPLPGVGSSGGEGVQTSAQPAAQLGGQEVFKRNVGKQQSPKAFEKMGLDLSAAESSLQDEANKYTEGYKTKAQQIKAPDYQQAIKGDQAAKSQVSGFLNSTDPMADKFESKTNVDVIPGLSAALKTGDPSGAVKQYLRAQSGPQYTQSEADLDYQLLSGDQGFQNIMSTLGQRQDALAQRAGRLGGELETSAAELFKRQTQGERDKLRGSLLQQAGTYMPIAEESLKKEVSDFTANRGLLDQGKRKALEAAGSDKSMQRFVNEINNDYYSKLPKPEDWRAEQFITPEMAQEYANIYELLGPDAAKQAAQLKADASGFDFAPDYSNVDILGQVQAREKEFNTGLDTQINEILGGVRGNLNQRQQDHINRLRGDVLSRDEFKDIGSAKQMLDGINVPFGAPLGEYDVINDQEKAKLLDLYQQREIDIPTLGANREREIRYSDELANALRAKINEARAAEQAKPIIPQKPIDITQQTPTGPIAAPSTPAQQIKNEIAANPPNLYTGPAGSLAISTQPAPAPAAPRYDPGPPIPPPPVTKTAEQIREEFRRNPPNLNARAGFINLGF